VRRDPVGAGGGSIEDGGWIVFDDEEGKGRGRGSGRRSDCQRF